jgi:hypothetical protein
LNALSKTRRTVAVLLFLAIAATAWLLLHQAMHSVNGASHHDVVFNPGYQHSQRLKVAAARAAMDVLGMASPDQAAGYQADYRLQRMQIRADAMGLERWAPNDGRHQGLLLEIRTSVAELNLALDQAQDQATSTAAKSAGAQGQIPLLTALNRAESAFSNYAASLTEPANLQTTPYLFASPVVLWWLLVLLLIELAILAWLVFSARKTPSGPSR